MNTHHDFRTSEYQHALENEGGAAWENTRGIGMSFGCNRAEDASHLLDGPVIARHLADVVSRGGNLLLNVGPAADGTIPDLQRRSLEQLGSWMAVHGGVVHGTGPCDVGRPGDDPWVRWTASQDAVWVLTDPAAGAAVCRPPVRTGWT